MPRRMRQVRIPIRGAVRAILLCVAAGCVSPQTVRCPIKDQDLTAKILEVAPVGTSREEAIRRLRAAGIDGAFGSQGSAFGKDYFCCQSWRQPSGEVWRISLLVHFDKSGNVCETLELPDLSASGPQTAKAARRTS